jgi:copper homeostasis protein
VQLRYEICVDSVDGTLAAQRAGADRVELCAAMFEGGLTPSLGMVQTTLAAVSGIAVHVIIRPRAGDFIFGPHEIAAMEHDIRAVREAGAHGVVIGALTSAGEVDRPVVERLTQAAGELSVAFHRAFDLTSDPHATLEELIDLGVERVLTSGQEASALEGAPLIAELVQQAGDRITVMAGGGVKEHTAARVVAQTGVRELHFSAFVDEPSPATHRNTRPNLGGTLRRPEYARQSTSADRITAIMTAAATITGSGVPEGRPE